MIDSSCKNAPVSAGNADGLVRETDYRLATFLAFGETLQNSRVALYGSGANARHILEAEERCFEVVAIADDNAVGKTMGTLTVSSLEDVLSQEIDVMVIAAEFASVGVVFYRIRNRCIGAGVRLLDMYGNDCAVIEASVRNALEQSFSAQLEQIESCDSVCINVGLFLDGSSTTAISKCVRYQGDITECLSPLIAYELAKGKTVAYYCFDPAMDERTAVSLLEQAGLAGTGSLFLAAETGLFAENGLYRLMYESLPSGTTVHVGCNILRDCLIPLCYGNRSVLAGFLEMPNSIRLSELKNEAVPKGAWYDDGTIVVEGAPDERLRSCTCAILPEVTDSIGEQASQVTEIVAPLVVGFVTWLANRLAQLPGEYDEVLFASRDGFLVKEVYDVFLARHDCGACPPSRYFYTSRKASRAAAFSPTERNGALRYFASCGFGMGKAYAFVEFVGAGTCQRQLERFVPFRLGGFYFGSRVGSALSRKLDAALYFGDRHASFFSRYLVLEPYLSSAESSLSGFDADGKPLFDAEYRALEELMILKDVHRGVVMFAREYFDHWYEEGDVVSPGYLNAIMPYLDLCDTNRMKLVDDLSGRVLTKQVDAVVPSDGQSAIFLPANEKTGNECRADDQTERREIASALRELLAVFDTVCGEFDLSYVATHGTLLGAMRGGGFVSGDDDIDVAMPRDDYDRLLELAERGVFPEPFALQTPENDPVHFTGGYAKLRNRVADVKRTKDSAHPHEEGVWIDILPLDNCPVDDVEVERRQRIVRIWQRLIYAKTYRYAGYLLDADPRKLSAYFILSDLTSRNALCRGLYASCTSVKPTGLLTCFAGNYRHKPNNVRYTEVDIAHAVRVPFENMTIPIPRHAEEWLDSHYGPLWRKAPDAEGGEI